jgi:hypothetical protein
MAEAAAAGGGDGVKGIPDTLVGAGGGGAPFFGTLVVGVSVGLGSLPWFGRYRQVEIMPKYGWVQKWERGRLVMGYEWCG